jgi:maltooligosyltrehalose trehalohydrolase
MVSDFNPGATYLGGKRCQFCVWAPLAQQVDVHIVSPEETVIALDRGDRGYYLGTMAGVEPGCLYYYRLGGIGDRPDPASRSQPQGVHGPSRVVDTSFGWNDGSWSGLPLEEYIIYELHVGVFSPEGTFDAVIPNLPELKELGIMAIELMPVAQFPGSRNWGYDGVYPFAVQDSYGGPAGLKRLVNACHGQGLAVVLDVVYNHLGPEGNYSANYGPYFTDRYQTPWGSAVNFDGPYSDEVRHFFIQNALSWLKDFHIDALRLDALHAIIDISASPFLKELALSVHQEGRRLNRRVYLIAESDRNDARLIQSPEKGGLGLDAIWNDDFHHALHTLLTGEQNGYYQDFSGFASLAKALNDGFVYTGQYSQYRKRRHGSPSRNLPGSSFIVFCQNHDQIGNRMLGERLSQLVSFPQLKLAAGILLLSPCVPLLFMGEEYGEQAPFLYFVSHSDPALVEAVRQGRRREFSAFTWQGEPPDPQDEATFLRSKLDHSFRHQGESGVLQEFYRELIRIRKELPALASLDRKSVAITAYDQDRVILMRRRSEAQQVLVIYNLNDSQVAASLPFPRGCWHKELDSAEAVWLGDGEPLAADIDSQGEVTLLLNSHSVVVYSTAKP